MTGQSSLRKRISCVGPSISAPKKISPTTSVKICAQKPGIELSSIWASSRQSVQSISNEASFTAGRHMTKSSCCVQRPSTNSLRTVTLLLSIFCCLFSNSLHAQDNFKVSNLQGTAKIQRSQRKIWDPLSNGEQIADNDIVETHFQTKLTVTFGTGNIILLGSNSKALFNFGTRARPELNITVFSGGLFIKIIDGTDVNIYTNNGVAQTDSGAVSTVVESKTGYTGFQLLGGSASVRNITQQEARVLNAGHTTIIRQGKAPTAPLYITFKHVAVLKHFFGDEYIENEMSISNIKPTESKNASNRISFSGSYTASQNRQASEGMYRKLFSLNEIYGAVLKERSEHSRSFTPIGSFSDAKQQGFSVAFQSRFFLGSNTYPAVLLSPAFGAGIFHGALRLPFSGGYLGMNFHLSGLRGILDKIGHLTVGDVTDSTTYAHIGPIENYSLNNGVVVCNFSNQNPYSAIQTLGLSFRYKKDLINVAGFIADITSPVIGGASLEFELGMTDLYTGYHFDADQYKQLISTNDLRYAPIPSSSDSNAVPSPDSVKAGVHIYELGLKTLIVDLPELKLGLSFDFAQKIMDGRTDGFVTKGPGIFAEWLWMRAGFGMTIESGRLISNQFHSFYLSNRLRVQKSENATLITTQNNVLSTERKASGFHLSYELSPFEGTCAKFSYKQDFATSNAFADTSQKDRNNYSFGLTLSIDDKFFKPIRFARLYLCQDHGGYYPAGARFFASWGLMSGFELYSSPFFRGLGLHLAGDFYYLDIDPLSTDRGRYNNNIDAGDFVFDLLLGAKWSF